MALIAARDLARRCDLVRIRQRKPGVGVIKSRIRPHHRVMTLAAQRRREPRGDVVRHISAKRGRAVPGRLVAAVTIRVRRREVVVVVDVAVRAGVHSTRRRHLVRTRQRPPGRAVIESRRQKRDGIVTVRAVRRRERCPCCRMHGVVGSLPAATVVGVQMAL